MIKKVLVFIIVAIICYDVYQLNNKKKPDTVKKIEIINNSKPPVKTNLHLENKAYSFIDNTKHNINESTMMVTDNEIIVEPDNDTIVHVNEFKEIVSPNLFGSPSDYKEGKYIIWEFQNPKPWNKIIYKNNEPYPFYFFIKIKIPSLNDYQNWKNIIQNIDFDPRSGEVIVPTNDEETALSIINLMISNFKGEISIEDIINKNLIDISINKAKKYDIVKSKLIDQIAESSKQPKTVKETFKDTPSFQKDLAENNTKPELSPYEGTEYSFI